MRLLWLAPVALMALLGGYLGLRAGRATMTPSEGEAIARYARDYVRDVEGGRMGDCVGRPGAGEVWIVVDCAPVPFEASRHRRYLVGHDGRARSPEGI